MVNWRQAKRKMRRDVHLVMGVPALLLASVTATSGIAITIRGPHHKREMNLVGNSPTGEGWAQREDTQPRLIFDRLELESKNLRLLPNVVISVEPGEAYQIAVTRPRDDEWIIAEVEPLTADEVLGLPVPEAM
ncbi:hypothetical protein AEAC466_04235 [Asticcacaulis sp. AC466]|uniref:hypothetical protein n=1 Tax=Asticcacaulis sp. AC466 TaxID=1282362 RepID=UPI0003C40FCD|nr:hypothetical protein [Asticcacaulis sp. AC466]ESQ85508.1 hypothetical protein AEAC466_04235 [Asticcacaulis sp. AC466]